MKQQMLHKKSLHVQFSALTDSGKETWNERERDLTYKPPNTMTLCCAEAVLLLENSPLSPLCGLWKVDYSSVRAPSTKSSTLVFHILILLFLFLIARSFPLTEFAGELWTLNLDMPSVGIVSLQLHWWVDSAISVFITLHAHTLRLQYF